MPHPDYPHEATADLPGVAFSAMRRIILAQAESAKLTVLEDTEGKLTVETAHGLIGLRPGASAETAGMVAGEDARWLFVMKNAVVAQMQHLMPTVAEAMRWSDHDAPGSMPPNFAFVRVTDVAPLGKVFLRATLKGEDLSAHGDASIHFRLVQPPQGAPAEWPSVAPNGSIKWPEGAGAPHKPVYTTRYIDHAKNELITDIYVHDGGRTTAWAQELMAGGRERQVVGVVGPAGGGLLQADHVLMASDETGFPAAARLLENLGHGARGTLLLEADEGAACDYPIAAPPGIETRWLSRAKGESLGAETQVALAAHPGAKIWFAGERGQATALRQAAQDAGWDKGDLRISGFWKDQTADL